MFGFVNQFLAGQRGERVGKSLLVLRIACLNVVIGDGIEEVLLLFGQLAVESAAVGQPLVVMGVGRVVRLSAAPVGLQRVPSTRHSVVSRLLPSLWPDGT